MDRLDVLEARIAALEARLAEVAADHNFAPNRSRAVTRQRLETLRQTGNSLTVRRIAEIVGTNPNATAQWIHGCVNRGELVRVAVGRYRAV